MHILEPFLAVIVAILSGFLAVSSWLATQIESMLPGTEVVQQEMAEEIPTTVTQNEDSLQNIPSNYERGGSIPDILIKNAAYQKATVFGSTETSTREAATSTEALESAIKNALVNVYCTLDTENGRRATTGSGVFIDERGVILTNAHVAQFLLLENDASDNNVRCIIRSGNPATPKYVAKLLYISPAWIYENAELIDAERASGTGERDYALLYISDTLEGAVPASFPALSLETQNVSRALLEEDLRAGGYPAEIILTEGARAALTPTVTRVSLSEFYTFGSGLADLVTVSDSSVGEQGSSGGPLVNERGEVIGLIVTKGTPEEGERSLRALTLSYIDRTIKEETGFDLATTLTGDLAHRGTVFTDALAPFLASTLNRALD